MPVQLSVGQRIRRLREERGRREGKNLTQQWLADQIGVSKSAVTKWELDIQQPGAEATLKLATLFGITPDTFVSQEAGNGNGMDADLRARVERELAPYKEVEVVDVTWLPRLLELVINTTPDPRARMVLVESINAAGRTQAAIREAAAAERRGEAMKIAETASDTRAGTARLAEENARLYHVEVFNSGLNTSDPVGQQGVDAVNAGGGTPGTAPPPQEPHQSRTPRRTRRTGPL